MAEKVEVKLTGDDLRRILEPREHQVLVLLARERGSHKHVAQALKTYESTVREAEASAREKIEKAKAQRFERAVAEAEGREAKRARTLRLEAEHREAGRRGVGSVRGMRDTAPMSTVEHAPEKQEMDELRAVQNDHPMVAKDRARGRCRVLWRWLERVGPASSSRAARELALPPAGDLLERMASLGYVERTGRNVHDWGVMTGRASVEWRVLVEPPVEAVAFDSGAGQDDGEVSPVSEPPTAEPDDEAGPAADHEECGECGANLSLGPHGPECSQYDGLGAGEEDSDEDDGATYVCALCGEDILNRQPFVENPDDSRSHSVCVTARHVRETAASAADAGEGVVEDVGGGPAPDEPAAPTSGDEDVAEEEWQPLDDGESEEPAWDPGPIPGNGHGPRAAVPSTAAPPPMAFPFGPGPIARTLGKMLEDLVGYGILSEDEAAPALDQLAQLRDGVAPAPRASWREVYLAVLLRLAQQHPEQTHVFDRVERMLEAEGDGEGRDTAASVRA